MVMSLGKDCPQRRRYPADDHLPKGVERVGVVLAAHGVWPEYEAYLG
jgi:hypothetical protein